MQHKRIPLERLVAWAFAPEVRSPAAAALQIAEANDIAGAALVGTGGSLAWQPELRSDGGMIAAARIDQAAAAEA